MGSRRVTFKILFLIRIYPVIPYNEINYIIGASMTTIPIQWYTTSLFATLPFTILLTLTGAYVQALMYDVVQMDWGLKPVLTIFGISFGSLLSIVSIVVTSRSSKKELKDIVRQWDENLDDTVRCDDEDDEEDSDSDSQVNEWFRDD